MDQANSDDPTDISTLLGNAVGLPAFPWQYVCRAAAGNSRQPQSPTAFALSVPMALRGRQPGIN